MAHSLPLAASFGISAGPPNQRGHSAERLASLLGAQVVQSIIPGPAHGPTVSMPLIYDEEDPLPAAPGGLLLHMGLAERAFTDDLLNQFAVAGYSGVVLKSRGEELLRVPETPPVSIIFIHKEVSWRQFFLLVSATTQRDISGLGQEFGSQGLFDIANSVALLIGGAVTIEDRERNVLAHSTVSGQQVDELRRDGILARRVPDLPKHDRQYRDLYSAADSLRFPFDPIDGELPRTAIAIRAGSEILGSIWAIAASNTNRSGSDRILRDAATATAVQLLRHRSAPDIESHLREAWLRSVLLDGTNEADGTHQFGEASTTGCALLALRVWKDGTVSSPYPSEIKSAALSIARLHGLDSCAALVGNVCFLLIISIPSEESGLRAAENIAASLSKRFDLHMRISVTALSINETDWVSVRQDLVDALSVSVTETESRAVVQLKDVRSELLLLGVSRHLQNLKRLLSPELKQLRLSDTSKDTGYEVTLLHYLSTMGDISEAAKRLHIHPNTLRYRLKKLTDTFGVDLSTPENILALWLQLWASGTSENG